MEEPPDGAGVEGEAAAAEVAEETALETADTVGTVYAGALVASLELAESNAVEVEYEVEGW